MKNIENSIYNFTSSFNPTVVNVLANLLIIILSVLFVFIINDMIKSQKLREKYSELKDGSASLIMNSMKKTRIKAFNYDLLDRYIKKSGLAYMTNYKITPLTYMMAKIGLAIFLMIVGLQVNTVFGLVLLPISYFGLDLIINLSDKSDNSKMLEDIKNIYDTLRIQTKAGVFITSTLTECYLVAKNKRLKSALLKLTSDVIAKNDLDESLDKFKNSFNNEYIDTLVIVIKQSMQTGQATKMFEDIRNQIKDIEVALAINEKNRINSKTIMVQMFIYFSIIIVAMYVTFVTVGDLL